MFQRCSVLFKAVQHIRPSFFSCGKLLYYQNPSFANFSNFKKFSFNNFVLKSTLSTSNSDNVSVSNLVSKNHKVKKLALKNDSNGVVYIDKVKKLWVLYETDESSNPVKVSIKDDKDCDISDFIKDVKIEFSPKLDSFSPVKKKSRKDLKKHLKYYQ